MRVKVDDEKRVVRVNAPCHLAVRPSSADHYVRFLSAYSPMLAPVENAFSAWKWEVKNRLSDPGEQAISDPVAAHNRGLNLAQWRRHRLQEIGEAAVPVVTADKVANWQNHCMIFSLAVLLEMTSL